LLHGDVTSRILAVFYEVHWELGPGFLESVYANGMACALSDAGIAYEREKATAVHFRGRRIGIFRADIVVEDCVLVELKAGSHLDPSAAAQTINYLRATNLQVGLVLHFGPRPAFKRLVVTTRAQFSPRASADSVDSAAKNEVPKNTAMPE
jgi:GxxExxY protein